MLITQSLERGLSMWLILIETGLSSPLKPRATSQGNEPPSLLRGLPSPVSLSEVSCRFRRRTQPHSLQQ